MLLNTSPECEIVPLCSIERTSIPSSNTTSWRFGSSSMGLTQRHERYNRLLIPQVVFQRQPSFALVGLYGRRRSVSSVSPRECVAMKLTSPLWPTLTKAHIGWKAPVPQARRWVRLWGCRRRTKLAHSVCVGHKRGHSFYTFPSPLLRCQGSHTHLRSSSLIPATTQKTN